MRERRDAEWEGRGYRGVAATPAQKAALIFCGLVVLAGFVVGVVVIRNFLDGRVLLTSSVEEQLIPDDDGTCTWRLEFDAWRTADDTAEIRSVTIEIADGQGTTVTGLPLFTDTEPQPIVVDVALATCPASTTDIDHGPLKLVYLSPGNTGTRQLGF